MNEYHTGLWEEDKLSELIDDLEVLKLVDDLMDEMNGGTEMISGSALTGNAEKGAKALGHEVSWISSSSAVCAQCGCSGSISLDPISDDGESPGTFYHGSLFNDGCDSGGNERGD